MTIIFFTLLIIILSIAALISFGPRPKLDSKPVSSDVPDIPIAALPDWLAQYESSTANLQEAARAHIQWASEPKKTDLCFLYLHGFSASWQETAPLTSNLAKPFKANIVQARIAGHGTGPEGMAATAEQWLQSITNQFDIAQRIGTKVIIVATSTGAPLSVWLALNAKHRERIAACLFTSPNFRIRNPFGRLLTWPWAPSWIHFIVGKEYAWEPSSALESQVWTHQYSTLSLIEMQKIVDWANAQDIEKINTPLAMMYMKNDETIFPPAALKVFERWGSPNKTCISVAIDGDATDHVFVGDITAPHRIDWCTEAFSKFLTKLNL